MADLMRHRVWPTTPQFPDRSRSGGPEDGAAGKGRGAARKGTRSLDRGLGLGSFRESAIGIDALRGGGDGPRSREGSPQPCLRLTFDLPHALAADAESVADLLERQDLSA